MNAIKVRANPLASDASGAELDRVDRAILRLLQRDASISNVALAAKANLSAPACLRRSPTGMPLPVRSRCTACCHQPRTSASTVLQAPAIRSRTRQ